MDEPTRADVERRTERWFVRQGIPHLIADYRATSDVFTRAAGFLYLVFVVQILNGTKLDWPAWLNALALAGSAGILLGGLALLNRSRGRPWYRRPDTIGPVELTAFVLLPAVLPVIFGTQYASGGATVLGNLVILGLTYLVVSYGVIPMIRWGITQTVRQLRDIVNVMARTLPLLLLLTMFMFLNAELWDVVDEIPMQYFVVSTGLLVGLGALFLLLQLPRELDDTGRFDSWEQVDGLRGDTPVADVSVAGLEDPPHPPPLGRRARFNVALLLYLGLAIQVLLVAVLIGLFYFVFGLFTVSESTISLWTDKPSVSALATWRFLDADLVVTGVLIRSSIFVATIAGLQFVVSALTDESYRREFSEDIVAELRQALAVRALYLARVVDRDRMPEPSAAP